MSDVPKKFNTKGGKNYKKNKTGRVRVAKTRPKIDVDGGDGYYGTVTKMCGCDNVTVQARSDNEIYRVQIPGRMYNRGGAKNRLKVGDEVLVSGTLDKNIIGIIDRIVRSNDVDYGEAVKNTKKSLFDDENNEDEVDETYDALLRQGKNGPKIYHKGGDKLYSTEEEILANLTIQQTIPEYESEDGDNENLPDLEE